MAAACDRPAESNMLHAASPQAAQKNIAWRIHFREHCPPADNPSETFRYCWDTPETLPERALDGAQKTAIDCRWCVLQDPPEYRSDRCESVRQLLDRSSHECFATCQTACGCGQSGRPGRRIQSTRRSQTARDHATQKMAQRNASLRDDENRATRSQCEAASPDHVQCSVRKA